MALRDIISKHAACKNVEKLTWILSAGFIPCHKIRPDVAAHRSLAASCHHQDDYYFPPLPQPQSLVGRVEKAHWAQAQYGAIVQKAVAM